MKQQRPPFGLRMPKDLHEWVRAKANEEGRSMNNFVVFILSRFRAEETAQK